MPKKKAQQRQQQRRAAQGAFGRALLHRRLYEHQQQQQLQQLHYRQGEEVEDQRQQQVAAAFPVETRHNDSSSDTSVCVPAREPISTSSSSTAAAPPCSFSVPSAQQQQQHAYEEVPHRAEGGLLFARQHRLVEYFRGKTAAQQRRGGGGAAGQLQSVTAQSHLEEFISTVLPLQQSCCLLATANKKGDFNNSSGRPLICRSSAASASHLSLATLLASPCAPPAVGASAAAVTATLGASVYDRSTSSAAAASPFSTSSSCDSAGTAAAAAEVVEASRTAAEPAAASSAAGEEPPGRAGKETAASTGVAVTTSFLATATMRGECEAPGAAQRTAGGGEFGMSELENCGVEVRLPRRPVAIRLAWFPGIAATERGGAGVSGSSSSRTRSARQDEAEGETNVAEDGGAATAAGKETAADTGAAAARRERLRARRRNRGCVRLLLSGNLAEAATLQNVGFIREQQQRQRIKWGKQQKKANEERRRRKAAAVRWKGVDSAAAAAAGKRRPEAGVGSSSSRSNPNNDRSSSNSSSSDSFGATALKQSGARAGDDSACGEVGGRASGSRRTSCKRRSSGSSLHSRRPSNSSLGSNSSSTSSGRWRSSSARSSTSEESASSRESSQTGSRNSSQCSSPRSSSRTSSKGSSSRSSRSSSRSSRSSSRSSRSSSGRSDDASPSVTGERGRESVSGGGEEAPCGIPQRSGSSAEAHARLLREATAPQEQQPRRGQRWGGAAAAQTDGGAAAAWDAREEEAFLQWRRELAEIEELSGGSFTLTPYERNFEVWKQLWRVAEKSHLLLQVVDGRDPAFYRSRDFERLTKELDLRKQVVLVINKADFMPAAVRAAWSKTLNEEGTPHIFFSALNELCAQKQRQQLYGAPQAQQRAEGNEQQQPAPAPEQHKLLQLAHETNHSSTTSATGEASERRSRSRSASGRASGGASSEGAEDEKRCSRSSNSVLASLSSGPATHPSSSSSRVTLGGDMSDTTSSCGSSSRSDNSRSRRTSGSSVCVVDYSNSRCVSPGEPGIWGSDDLLSFLVSRRRAYVENFYDALERQHQQQQDRWRPSALQQVKETKGHCDWGISGEPTDAACAAAAACTQATVSATETSNSTTSPLNGVPPAVAAADPATAKPGTAAAAAPLPSAAAPARSPPAPRPPPSGPLPPAFAGAAGSAVATTAAAAGNSAENTAFSAAAPLLSTRREALRQSAPAPAFVVGLIGFPNVGKSSLINALFGCKRVSVSKQPGKTKHLQTLPVGDTGVVLCDCPGLVFPRCVTSKHHLVANGVLPLDTMGSNYLASVQVVCDRVPPLELLSRYGLVPHADATAGELQRLQQHAVPHSSQQQRALLASPAAASGSDPGAAPAAAFLAEQPGRVVVASVASLVDPQGNLRVSAAGARPSVESAGLRTAVTAADARCMQSRQQQDLLWTGERRGVQQGLQAATFLEAVATQRKFRAGGRGGQLDLYRAAALVLADYRVGRLVACRGPDGRVYAGRASGTVLEAEDAEQQQVRTAHALQQHRHQQGRAGETEPQQQHGPSAETPLERAQQQKQQLQNILASASCSIIFKQNQGRRGDAGGVEKCAGFENEQIEGEKRGKNEALGSALVPQRAADSSEEEMPKRQEETAAKAECAAGGWQHGAAATGGTAVWPKGATRHRREDAPPEVGAAATDSGTDGISRKGEAGEEEEGVRGVDGERTRRKEFHCVQRNEGRSSACGPGDYVRSEIADDSGAVSLSVVAPVSTHGETVCSAVCGATEETTPSPGEQTDEAFLREIFASTQDDALLQLLKDGGSDFGLNRKQQGQHQMTLQQEKGFTNRKRRYMQKQALKGKITPAGQSTTRRWL